MKAFLDGSGDLGKEFMVLTGVAARDEIWGEFDQKWKAILTDRTPSATQLHTTDLLSGSGEFSRDNGWNEEKAWTLIWDCVKYAKTLDKKDFRAFICTVDVTAYLDIKRHKTIHSPYSLCTRFVPDEIRKWYFKDFQRHFPQELYFRFDNNEKYRGRFHRKWVQGRKSGRRILNSWHLIKAVDDGFAVDYPGIQFADLISWMHFRRLMYEKHGTTQYKRGSDFWKVIEGVIPFRRAELSRDRLELLSDYSRMITESVIQEFGPFSQQ